MNYCTCLVTTVLVALFFSFGDAFRVFIHVPAAVERGGRAVLTCIPELFVEDIHRITWLKDGSRIYRYKQFAESGKEREKFRMAGIEVDELTSNLTHLVIPRVDIEYEGNYTCQVESRGPSFYIKRNSSDLRVYSIPKEYRKMVTLTQENPRGVGDLICVSAPTYPEVKISWYIDGEPASPERVVNYPTGSTPDNLKISESRLRYKENEEASYSCEGVIRFNKFSVKAVSQRSVITGSSSVEAFTHETLDELPDQEDGWDHVNNNGLHSEPFRGERKKKKNAANSAKFSFLTILLNLVLLPLLY